MGCLCVMVSSMFQALLCCMERLASKVFYSILLCGMFFVMILLCVYGVTLGYHYSKKEIIAYKLTSTVAYRWGFRRSGSEEASQNEQDGRRSNNQDVQDAIRSFKLDQLTLKRADDILTTKSYSSPIWYPSIENRNHHEDTEGDEGEDRDRELLQQLNLLNDIQPPAPPPPARLRR